MSFVLGPVAPENNPPIKPQWFKPSAFVITAITYGITTTITTEEAFGVNANYVPGQLVRLTIPFPYGAQQLNEVSAYVKEVSSPNTVVLFLNTSEGFDPFIPSPSNATSKPFILAIGSINSGSLNSNPENQSSNIAGSFQNISPYLGN